MFNTETVQKAINFTRSLADISNNLCPNCQNIIREELTGDEPVSKSSKDKTTAEGVNSYYDRKG